jgi:superfamily II DNA or RNA helicase
MTLEPNVFQKQALEELHLNQKSGEKGALVVLPSASGKTHTAAFHIKAVKPKGKVIFLAHRIEILKQASKIFKEVIGLDYQKDIGFVSGRNERYDFDKKYIFAMVQTLSKDKHLAKLNPKQVDYLIIDEYHHISAKTYEKLVTRLPNTKKLGLTATPYRYDKKDIYQYIDGNIVINKEIPEGIEKGLVQPFDYLGLFDNIDYSDIQFQRYKYKESDLDKKLIIKRRNEQIINEFNKEIGPNKQTIGFCATVKHANRMTLEFNKAGIKSAVITHFTKPEDRATLLNQFTNRQFQVLFTKDIFNEGADFPFVEALLFLRPTHSKNVFFQQLGRGLRPLPNKPHVKVLDFIGNYHNAKDIETYIKEAAGKNIQIVHSRTHKPEYHHKVSQVYFDKELIDIFEYQRYSKRYIGITKKELIEEYKRIVNLNGGKFISVNNFVNKLRFKQRYGFDTKCSIAIYIRRFGSWSNFIKEFNKATGLSLKVQEHNMYFNLTNEDIIKEYLEDAKEHGRKRNIGTLLKEGKRLFRHNSIKRRFGSISNFYELVRNVPKCLECGKSVIISKENRKYCSDECHRKKINAKARKLHESLTPEQKEKIRLKRNEYYNSHKEEINARERARRHELKKHESLTPEQREKNRIRKRKSYALHKEEINARARTKYLALKKQKE